MYGVIVTSTVDCLFFGMELYIVPGRLFLVLDNFDVGLLMCHRRPDLRVNSTLDLNVVQQSHYYGQITNP